MIELKPCPFCGANAKVRRSEFGYKAFCDKPFCCWIGTFRTEQEAITAWNTRAERNCTVEGEEYDDLLEIFSTVLSCGHYVNDLARYIKYCPECGAKVVERNG